MKLEKIPVKLENIPVKLENIPVKLENILAKLKNTTAKLDNILVKLENMSLRLDCTAESWFGIALWLMVAAPEISSAPIFKKYNIINVLQVCNGELVPWNSKKCLPMITTSYNNCNNISVIL